MFRPYGAENQYLGLRRFSRGWHPVLPMFRPYGAEDQYWGCAFFSGLAIVIDGKACPLF